MLKEDEEEETEEEEIEDEEEGDKDEDEGARDDNVQSLNQQSEPETKGDVLSHFEELMQSEEKSVAAVSAAAAQCRSSAIQSSTDGPVFVVSKYGTKQLIFKQHTFNRHVSREDVTYWRCSQFAVLRCRARIKTKGTVLSVLNCEHNHDVITKTRKYGSLKSLKLQAAASAAAAATAKVASFAGTSNMARRVTPAANQEYTRSTSLGGHLVAVTNSGSSGTTTAILL